MSKTTVINLLKGKIVNKLSAVRDELENRYSTVSIARGYPYFHLVVDGKIDGLDLAIEVSEESSDTEQGGDVLSWRQISWATS